jgi:AcrR family transcriptional regulator
MSRRTFYGHFDNVEDCFLAAYEAIRDDALAVLDSAPVDAPPEERLAEALEALLGHFAAWPDHAMLLMVHILGAGPDMVAEHERTMSRLARRLADCLGGSYGDAHGEPLLVAHAAIGAMQRVVQVGLLRDAPRSLPRLGPTLTAVALRMAA